MKEKGISIKINEIKELSFSNKLFDELIENFDSEKVKIKLGFGVVGNPKKNRISIKVMINFLYVLKKNKNPKSFLELESITEFKIHDFTDEDIEFISDEETFIDDDLMYVFLNTAIGATRGMLAYKIASLPINLVLPLFSIDQIIESQQASSDEI